MKRLPTFLIATILIGSLFSSCNTDKDDDDPYTPPTLNFEFDVTGDMIMSESFTSPENSNTLGGHAHAVISTNGGGFWSLSGNGTASGGLSYTWTIAFNASGVSTGSYSVTQAQFGTTQHAYPELVAGTVNITSAALGQDLSVGSFHSASGNFTVQLQDQANPPATITFEGSFTGLHVTAS